MNELQSLNLHLFYSLYSHIAFNDSIISYTYMERHVPQGFLIVDPLSYEIIIVIKKRVCEFAGLSLFEHCTSSWNFSMNPQKKKTIPKKQKNVSIGLQVLQDVIE